MGEEMKEGVVYEHACAKAFFAGIETFPTKRTKDYWEWPSGILS